MRLYKQKSDEKFDLMVSSKEDVNNLALAFVSDIVQKNYRSNDNIPENIKTMLSSDKDSSKDDTSPLAWPIYPIEHITRYFNDANFEKEN
jgi:hypothetical protein